MIALAARFRAQVAPPDEQGCMRWLGTLNSGGYGLLGHARATHIALALDGRPRPGKLFALHSCDNPPCVNPEHLRWGTQADNMRDVHARGRVVRATVVTPQLIAAAGVLLADGLDHRTIAARLGVTLPSAKRAIVAARMRVQH